MSTSKTILKKFKKKHSNPKLNAVLENLRPSIERSADKLGISPERVELHALGYLLETEYQKAFWAELCGQVPVKGVNPRAKKKAAKKKKGK